MIRILFATNGQKPAADAGALLRTIVHPEGVEVTVNVCDSVEFSYPLRDEGSSRSIQPRPQPEEVASAEVARFEEAGIRADSNIGVGIPAGQILDKGERGGYDITAMGAGSTSWLGNLLLGSTSMRVLHASDTSVLIVHRFEGGERKARVLLATDGSADAELSVRTLLGLADPNRVELKVISVADLVPHSAAQYDDEVPPDEVMGHLKSKAVVAVDEAAQPLIDAGFAVSVETPTGDPARRILEYAKEADLAVVGSRGLGPASRLALGSVSDQVARLAPAALVCRKV